MDDLISRQAAIDALAEVAIDRFNLQDTFQECLDALNDAESKIKRLPSSQPEQKKGKWLEYDDGEASFYCSECGKHQYGNFSEIFSGEFNYCPNCGADMRGGEK